MNTQHMTRIKFSILLKGNGYIQYKRDDIEGYNYYLLDKESYFYLNDYMIFFMNCDNDELFSYNFHKQNISDFNQNLVESSLDLGYDILPAYQRNLKLEKLLEMSK